MEFNLHLFICFALFCCVCVWAWECVCVGMCVCVKCISCVHSGLCMPNNDLMLACWSYEWTNQRMFGVQTLGVFKNKMLSYSFMSYTLIKRFHAIYFTILLKCWLHLSSQTCSSSFANSELYVGCGRVCAIHPCCCYCRYSAYEMYSVRPVCDGHFDSLYRFVIIY